MASIETLLWDNHRCKPVVAFLSLVAPGKCPGAIMPARTYPLFLFLSREMQDHPVRSDPFHINSIKMML